MMNIRWIVKEKYFGKFDQERIICYCNCFDDARFIIDALVANKKGRPFCYKAEKVADDFVEVYDAVIVKDLFTDEVVDYSEYLLGITTL